MKREGPVAPLRPRVQVPGAAIAHELEGDPQAPVLVLIHGVGASLHVWDAHLEALCRSFRVLRFDLRGHGRSSTPPGGYTLHGLAQDLIGLLDYLQFGDVHVAGNDIGARVALQMAAQYPNRVNRIVACGLNTARASAPRTDPTVVRKRGMEAMIRPTLEQWLTPSFRQAHPAEVERLAEMVRRTRPEGWIGCTSLLEAAMPLPVHGGDVPTLLLAGSAASAHARDAEGPLRFARHEIIDSPAHLAHLEHPGRFNALVRDFLLDTSSQLHSHQENV